MFKGVDIFPYIFKRMNDIFYKLDKENGFLDGKFGNNILGIFGYRYVF